MSGNPSVVVKKGGFLASLATGLFTFLTAAVICGSSLGFYALHIMDNNASRLLSVGQQVLAGLPEWRKALPPALSDALNDAREPAYREQLETSAQLVRSERNNSEWAEVVLRVKNNGPRTVSVMAARVVVSDDRDVPVHEFSTYVATPITIDDCDEWRGPLLPGSERTVRLNAGRARASQKASVEITELRIWNEQPPRSMAAGGETS